MTEPLTQAWVEGEIARLSALLEHATHECARRGKAAAEADAAYDRAYYTTFVQADGAMDARKAAAKVECADLYAAKVMAEAVHDSAKEAGRNMRAQLDGLRSLGANLRPLTVAS